MNAVSNKTVTFPSKFERSPLRTSPLESRRSAPTLRSVPTMDRLDMSSKAAEIQASDVLKTQWTSMMVSNNPAPPAADPFRSATKMPLEGFDQAKLDNPEHRTPKYLFGRVAQNFKLDSVQGDKAKAEDLLKAMVPELQAAGLEVVAVAGDRIQVKTEVGYEWVDVVRGAGSDSPGWWWGSEAKGTLQPTETVQEWAAQTGQTASMQAPVPAAGGASAAHKVGLPGPPEGPVLAILKKFPPTNEGIKAAMPEVSKLHPGAKVLDHPIRLDKIQFADGAVVDVIVGSGGPSPSWGWMPE